MEELGSLERMKVHSCLRRNDHFKPPTRGTWGGFTMIQLQKVIVMNYLSYA
jgi:hypothetical protein